MKMLRKKTAKSRGVFWPLLLSMITLVAHGNTKNDQPQLKPIVVVNALTFQLPNGTVIIKKPNEAPYCAAQGTCDFSIDCYANEPAPKLNFTWECRNAAGVCVGKCYQQPIASKQDALQKFLAAIDTNGASK